MAENKKALASERAKLFRAAAKFENVERVPHLSCAVTWKIFDAGYTLDQALTDYDVIEKADSYGIKLSNLHIDPCVLALATMPGAFADFCECIRSIHEFAPDVKVAVAISNVSFNMPCRKFVNMAAMVNAVNAGLDTIIMDPTSENMQGIMYASYALNSKDPGGRAYNRAYRKGYFGQKK